MEELLDQSRQLPRIPSVSTIPELGQSWLDIHRQVKLRISNTRMAKSQSLSTHNKNYSIQEYKNKSLLRTKFVPDQLPQKPSFIKAQKENIMPKVIKPINEKKRSQLTICKPAKSNEKNEQRITQPLKYELNPVKTRNDSSILIQNRRKIIPLQPRINQKISRKSYEYSQLIMENNMYLKVNQSDLEKKLSQQLFRRKQTPDKGHAESPLRLANKKKQIVRDLRRLPGIQKAAPLNLYPPVTFKLKL